MSKLVIVRYNVKRINHPMNRKQIRGQLKEGKCSVALLQETHLSLTEHRKVRREWVEQVFYAFCPNSRKRGEAAVMSRSVSVVVQSEVEDKQGRSAAVTGQQLVFDIMNIYNPNKDF